MTEFSPSSVRLGFVALYLLVTPLLAVWLTRIAGELRRYSYLLLSVVVLSAVTLLLQEAGIGQLEVGAGTVDVVNISRSVFVYIVVYGGVVKLAGASNRLAGVVTAVALTPIIAVGIAPALGAGTLAIGVLAALVLPYPVLLYLFFRPVWQAAATTSPSRRLLHWKARNVIVFTYSMTLLFVFMAFGGLVTDDALATFFLEYTFFFFRAGIPAFLIYKFAGMDDTEARTIVGDLTGAAG